jgi:hypothetical protein
MSARVASGEALARRARLRFAHGDLLCAAELLLRAADAYSGEGNAAKVAWALGSAGYACFVGGETDRGLSLLERAAAMGYDDLEKIDGLSSLKLRGRPAAVHPAFVRLRSRIRENAGRLVTEEWLNQTLHPWRWMSFCRVRDLARLRPMIPRLAPGDEMAVLLQCLSWVHGRFEHDPERKASHPDPITILREARDKRRLTCQEYALLLSSVLQCHGRPARVIAAARDNYHHGYGKGHWLIEAWSDTLSKWIVMDPQNNCIWRRGRELLNGAELRCALATGAADGIVPSVNGRESLRLMPWLQQFRTLWFYHSQDYFAGWDPLGPVEELGDRPQVLFQGRRRAHIASHSEARDLYPAMRRIHFAVKPGEKYLRFVLEHSYPFFSHYEMSVNGARLSRCTATPRVFLRKGRTRVRFRVGGKINSPSDEVGLTVLCDVNGVSHTR